MNITDKTTQELQVLKEKIDIELSQRSDEPEFAVLKMFGFGDESEIFDKESLEIEKDYIFNTLKRAIDKKNRIFNIKLVMIPETDYKKLKNDLEI